MNHSQDEKIAGADLAESFQNVDLQLTRLEYILQLGGVI